MIRRATPADIESITAVYNEVILEGGFTGDLEPLSIDSRRAWFAGHRDRYAVFVKDIEGTAVGYSALSPYRNGRKAFDATCEISYFLSRRHRGSGIGRQLIEYAIEQAATLGFDVMVAITLGCNERSIDLLVRRGFSISGRVPDAAKIGGTYFDHVLLSRRTRP
jgi:phosphinothricin acetyltransferase